MTEPNTHERIRELDEFILANTWSKSRSSSRLEWTQSDGVYTVRFIDRNILDEANIQQIGEEFARFLDAHWSPILIISFKNVQHLSSAANGTLITVHNRVLARAGTLMLADIDPQIYEVFVITKLNRLFRIYETTDQAMAAARPFAGKLTRDSSAVKRCHDVPNLINVLRWARRLDSPEQQVIVELQRKYISSTQGDAAPSADEAAADLRTAMEIVKPPPDAEVTKRVLEAIEALSAGD